MRFHSFRCTAYNNEFRERSDSGVQATISDKRRSVCNEELGIAYFEAEILTQTDYYPFGVMMPDRQWSAGAEGYRYGFNTQEKDDEIYGTGNSYSAEFWQYDSRFGLRWNLDPKGNPSLSFYACFAGNPIMYSDPKGDTLFTRGPNVLRELQGMVSNTNTNRISIATLGNPEDAGYRQFLQVNTDGYTSGSDAGLDLLISLSNYEVNGVSRNNLYEVVDLPSGTDRANDGMATPIQTPYQTRSEVDYEGVQYKTDGRKAGILVDDPNDSPIQNNGPAYPAFKVTHGQPGYFAIQISIHSRTRLYYSEARNEEPPRSMGVFLSLQTALLNRSDADILRKNLDDHRVQAMTILRSSNYQGQGSGTAGPRSSRIN